MVDADGVSLAAIQGLYWQNKALQRQNKAIHRREHNAPARLGAQNTRLTKLSQAFSKLPAVRPSRFHTVRASHLGGRCFHARAVASDRCSESMPGSCSSRSRQNSRISLVDELAERE